MKKILLLVFIVPLLVKANGPYPVPGGATVNQFALPFTLSQLLYPTNFLTANPAATNTVVVYHKDGTTTTYTASPLTDVGRGNALGLAMDSTVAAGDVFFCSAGRFDVSQYAPNNAFYAFDLSGPTFGGAAGCSFVGAGTNSTIIDFGGTVAGIGNLSCLRDVTMTNFQLFADLGNSATSITNNQFMFFQNVCLFQPTNYIDIFILSHKKDNLWVENCTFNFTYDVFAMSILPLTNAVLVSHNTIYNANAQNTQPITRVQYGTMARVCYVSGDTITCSGGTNNNIGLDNSDSGRTNSTLYAWNTKVSVSGPGHLSVWNGVFTNNAIFLGSGNIFDSGSAVPNNTTLNLQYPAVALANTFTGSNTYSGTNLFITTPSTAATIAFLGVDSNNRLASTLNGNGFTNVAQNTTTYTNFLFGSLFTNTSTRNELVSVNARCNPTTTLSAQFALVTSPTGVTYTTNAIGGLEADTIFTTAPHSWYQLTVQVQPGGIWKVVDVTGQAAVTITNSYYQTLQ